MRDPQASLTIGDTAVTRHLHAPLPSDHLLRTELARGWVADGRLVPFAFDGDREIHAPKLGFVSQPTEWCDDQLLDAGALTLGLQQEAVEGGYDLKDASAWNVLFDGCRPVFCDLLSFQPLVDRPWWADGQFARHFILPLAVARLKGLHGRTAFVLSRDGLSPEDARRLLGPARFLTRYWPAMAEGRKTASAPVPAPAFASRDAIARYRRGLQESFRWMLGQRVADMGRAGSNWSRYRDERGHYAEGSVDRKRELVGQWLKRLAPDWLLDLGCNTGEFSRMASAGGSRVVALDSDHDAIQALYRAQAGDARIHPVIAPLDDLSGGRGWGGAEHPGLVQRLEGRFDVVLMLALVHHLGVSSAIPLAEVAKFLRRCTRRWAVVEWISETDPQMELLCWQRQRQPGEFGLVAQRAAFCDAGFVVREGAAISDGRGILALLEVEAGR